MSTVNIIATYCGDIDDWEVFRLDGINLNLFGGQRMVPLADDTVTVTHENSHYVLRVLRPKDNFEHLVELFGLDAFDHLDALARLNPPASPLEEIENRLQDALAAREAEKYRRPELLEV